MIFNKYLITIFCGFFTSFISTMQDIVYRQAQQHDVDPIIKLINKHGIHDKNKIVILPKRFQHQAIDTNIRDGKLYVAYKNDEKNNEKKLVGYKKLYLMSDESERNNTLENEIRCIGQNSRLLKSGRAEVFGKIKTDDFYTITYHDNDTYIYNGADFTHPKFRGNNINKILMNKSLESIKKDAIQSVQKNKSSNLIMVYGLTKINAGEGEGFDRTPSIVKSFIPFAQEVYKQIHPNLPPKKTVDFYAYEAFMPTFDLDADECKPLPDDQSIPGYGNVLRYKIRQNK